MMSLSFYSAIFHILKSNQSYFFRFGRDLDEIYTRRRPTSRLRQSASVGGVGSSDQSYQYGYQQGSPGYLQQAPPQGYQVAQGYQSPPGFQGPVGETVVLAQGRHVRSSLQRLQRTQDDWFQL